MMILYYSLCNNNDPIGVVTVEQEKRKEDAFYYLTMEEGLSSCHAWSVKIRGAESYYSDGRKIYHAGRKLPVGPLVVGP